MAALLALIALPLNLAYTAPASTFTATSLLDTIDANPGDCKCADADGNCSLRAAVMEANLSAGPDTIVLLEDIYQLTITGIEEDNAATGDLDIKGTLTITGAGFDKTIIDAELSDDRGFQILSNADVTVSEVTIRNVGSSINSGGGIYNDGIHSITNSIVSDNRSGYGGGIINYGELTLTDSVVSGKRLLKKWF